MSGTINASFTYAPFGEVVEATSVGGALNGLPFHRRRMNDKFVDEVSGLAYYGYRYYDKLSMSWTQSDPLFRFAPDAKRSQPRHTLLYTANLNNPLRYLDPDGRSTDAINPEVIRAMRLLSARIALTGPAGAAVAAAIVATTVVVANWHDITRPIASRWWDWVKDAVRPAPLPPPTPPQADDDKKKPGDEKKKPDEKPDGDYRQPGDGEKLPEPESGPPRPPNWPDNQPWPPWFKRPPLGPMKCFPDLPTESAPELARPLPIESGGNSAWTDADEAAWMYNENKKGDTPSEAFR